MLRISRSNLARAWIAIKDITSNPGGYQAAWDRVRGNANDIEDRLLEQAQDDNTPLNEIEEFFRTLALSKDSYDDGRVIDDLLDAVSRSYARNRIDSRAFEMVKVALMTPGDHAKLSATLAKDEGHCVYCGHVFIENEVAVYRVEQVPAGRRGFVSTNQPAWYCTRCVHPDFHACMVPECHGQVPMNQKARAILSNANLKCPTHQAEAIEEFRKTGKAAKEQEADIPFDRAPANLWGVGAPAAAPLPDRFANVAQRLRPTRVGTATARDAWVVRDFDRPIDGGG